MCRYPKSLNFCDHSTFCLTLETNIWTTFSEDQDWLSVTSHVSNFVPLFQHWSSVLSWEKCSRKITELNACVIFLLFLNKWITFSECLLRQNFSMFPFSSILYISYILIFYLLFLFTILFYFLLLFMYLFIYLSNIVTQSNLVHWMFTFYNFMHSLIIIFYYYNKPINVMMLKTVVLLCKIILGAVHIIVYYILRWPFQMKWWN